MEEKERFWEISIDCFVYFASARKWMRFREKKNGAIRNPNQMAGITKDFQSECNMRIFSAYSVR